MAVVVCCSGGCSGGVDEKGRGGHIYGLGDR